MDLKDVETIAKIVSDLGAVIAAGFAASTYRRAVRTRRAEWLFSLFERFYERPTYQRIRSILDSWRHPTPEFKRLESDVQNDSESPDVDALINYLNFFEFIAVLWKRGQLKENEICELFDYYLRNLKSVAFVEKYIRTQGFERLAELLDQRER